MTTDPSWTPRPRPTDLRPALQFTPYAWAKLLHLRDAGDTEIGAFGLSHPRKLLRVEDLMVVTQRTTSVTVAFDDDAVADYFEQQALLGRHPREFARIWLHTHPGHSASPSSTDEETFERVFRGCDWAVMFILARSGGTSGGTSGGGETYARLRIGHGLNVQLPLPVEIDYAGEFPASDFRAWGDEYRRCVHPEPHAFAVTDRQPAASCADDDHDWPGFDPTDDLDPHVLAAYEAWQPPHPLL